MRAALALCLMAAPVWAETTLTAPEFEGLSQGRTLTFEFEGAVFGREMYLAERKVVWQEGLNGVCHLGRWRPGDKGAICFEYEGALSGRPHCLRFVMTGGNVWVYSVREPDKKPLNLAKRSRKPLSCPNLAAPKESA